MDSSLVLFAEIEGMEGAQQNVSECGELQVG